MQVSLVYSSHRPRPAPFWSTWAESTLKTRGAQPKDDRVSSFPRGNVIKFMANCDIHSIVGAGGSRGTSLAAEVMRDKLPIGFPKVGSYQACRLTCHSNTDRLLLKMIASTVANGDTGPM